MRSYKFSVTFNLVTRDIVAERIKTKPVRINAILRFDSKKIVFNNVDRIILGKYKISEKNQEYVSDSWDFKKQFPKSIYTKHIKRLNEVKEIISNIFITECQVLERFPGQEELKELHKLIDDEIKGKAIISSKMEDSKTNNLLVYIANYIKDCISNPHIRTMVSKTGQKVPYKKRSVQSFLNTLNKLITMKGGDELKFKSLADPKVIANLPLIRFDEIDLKFYNELQSFLAKEDLKVNYFGSQVKYIKKFMNTSLAEGFHANLAYKDRQFTKQATKADNVSFTFEQLNSLEKYDFSNNQRYDIARDWSLIGAWTGLRYSDYSRLTRANLSNGYIDTITKKTGQQVVIPILKPLQRVLEKYKDSDTGFPPKMSDVDLNATIKEVCKVIGENRDPSFLKVEKVTQHYISGPVVEEIPFWNRVCTHSGRRSFCTNAVRMNIPKTVIMAISGHTTEKAFDLYVGIQSREYATMLSDYFKNIDL